MTAHGLRLGDNDTTEPERGFAPRHSLSLEKPDCRCGHEYHAGSCWKTVPTSAKLDAGINCPCPGYEPKEQDNANYVQVCTCPGEVKSASCAIHGWFRGTPAAHHLGLCPPGCTGCPCGCHFAAVSADADRRGAEQPADASELDSLNEPLCENCGAPESKHRWVSEDGKCSAWQPAPPRDAGEDKAELLRADMLTVMTALALCHRRVKAGSFVGDFGAAVDCLKSLLAIIGNEQAALIADATEPDAVRGME